MENMEMKDRIVSAVSRNFCIVDQVDATESYIFAVLLCCGEFIVNNDCACCRLCCLHCVACSNVGKKRLLHSKFKLTAPVSVSKFPVPVL